MSNDLHSNQASGQRRCLNFDTISSSVQATSTLARSIMLTHRCHKHILCIVFDMASSLQHMRDLLGTHGIHRYIRSSTRMQSRTFDSEWRPQFQEADR